MGYGNRSFTNVYTAHVHCKLILGQCIGRFTNQKTPYCLAFNPDEDKQHLFIVGCADKKIYTVSTELM